VLENGTTAMLVPPYSPGSIAQAVETLADAQVYQNMSRAGRKFVEQEISWERYANELLSMFNTALAAQK
jgi:glycosyltransferase involved in cell wall biosynthesis